MENSYDYIIVGSGTAGCVLANRLSSDRDISVCLIEAGPPDTSPLVHVPAAVGALLFHKKMGWGYRTTPQKGLNERQIPLPRGRVLGGCSSTNGMVYFRGQPRDYDEWARMGNTGWSFREVLPYFLRSENNLRFGGSPWHGRDGPMIVSDMNRLNPMIVTFLAAAYSLGYPRCEDFNAALDPIGFNSRQGCIHNGRRVSGVTAFIDPIKYRQNLTILTKTVVTRINLDKRRAVGLEMNIGGETRKLKARREIILSAGTFGSPQILMLSGIGDGADLSAMGIAVQHDLPAVGRNFHDHPAIGIIYRTENTESYGLSLKAFPRDVWNLIEYILFRRGPLASFLFEAMGFMRTTEGLDRPDIQFVFQPATRPTPRFPIPVGHGYAMNPVLLYPKSRGRVTLASPDPHAMPLIDPNLLGDPEDIPPLLRAIRISRTILNAPAFDRYQGIEKLPGPERQDDDALVDYLRNYLMTVHHPVSTCRMGGDAESVVDPELRVRGIEGLRVADASIFPRLVGGNTNAGVVMVAEKASDLILGIPAPVPFIPVDEN
jgi:choline dehydrogenase-like flavoprotein